MYYEVIDVLELLSVIDEKSVADGLDNETSDYLESPDRKPKVLANLPDMEKLSDDEKFAMAG